MYSLYSFAFIFYAFKQCYFRVNTTRNTTVLSTLTNISQTIGGDFKLS